MTRAELEGKIETMCRESGLDHDDLVLIFSQLLERFECEIEDQGEA